MVQKDDYYPFGLTFNTYSSGTENLYKYNGFEELNDFDLNLYHYKTRHYDPAIGKFLQIDPASEVMRRFSVYSYAFDNPILYIDPDGMMPQNSNDSENFFRWLIEILGLNPNTPPKSEEEASNEAENREKWNNVRKKFIEVRDTQRELFDYVPLVGPLTNAALDSKSGLKSNKEIAVSLGTEAIFELVGGKIINKLGDGLVYILKSTDIDLRKTETTFREALDLAFEKTGLSKDDFSPTKWAKTADGKSIPVEYRSSSGAEISIDFPHNGQNGPDAPHIGYQTGGKRGTGGAVRGHIILNEVPAGRPAIGLDK